MSRNFGLRKRIWSGTNASARDVGESMRDLAGQIDGAVGTKRLKLLDQVYGGTVQVSMSKRPEAILCIHVEDNAGFMITGHDVPTSWEWDGSTATISIGGLTTGSRYSVITLWVVF